MVQSSAGATPLRLFSGRKPESAVWQYFKFNSEINESVCQVITNDMLCGYSVAKNLND